MQVISLFATSPYLAYIHYASSASLYIASASILSIVNKIKWPNFLNWYCSCHCLTSGADPGFFLGGGAPLRNDVTDGEVTKF